MLQSARVLGALDYSVEGTQEDQGMSRLGTSDAQVISSDVLRKLLVQMETKIEVDEAALAREKVEKPFGHLGQHKSRRSAQGKVDACDAQVCGRGIGDALVRWYRDTVRPSLLAHAQLARDTSSIS